MRPTMDRVATRQAADRDPPLPAGAPDTLDISTFDKDTPDPPIADGGAGCPDEESGARCADPVCVGDLLMMSPHTE
jgi:hypothetical protein